MNTETQASLLAEWLNHPGTPPPAGLDPDVVQAAIALRPELAPAPTLSVDDILAGITTGPFAEAALGAAGDGPQGRSAELPLDQAEELEPANSPQVEGVAPVIDLASRRRRRVWGGVGLLAAAALVLVSVGPQFLNQAPEEVLAPQALPGAEEQLTRGPAEPPPAPLQQELNKSLDNVSERPNNVIEPSSAAGGSPPTEAGLDAASTANDAKRQAAPLTASSTPSSYGEVSEESEGAADPAPVVASTGSTRSGSYSQMDLETVETATKEKGRFKLRGDKGEADEAAVADNFEYALDDEDDAPAEPEDLPSDLDGLRSAAAPGDYRGGWYLTGLDGADYDRFEAAIDTAQGQSGATKTATYAALIPDPNALIGQDMAFRAAVSARSSGDSASALRYLRAGQARSSMNTAQRANLFYLEGQILEAQGDSSGALAAYRVAANMNQAR